MYQTDFDDFQKLMADLCTSVNRPCNDDLVRVFWEDLRELPLSTVRTRAKLLRTLGKTKFTSNDLRPPPEEQKAALQGPSIAAQLSDYVLRTKQLTDRQIRGPWLYTRDKDGAVTGVIVQADGEHSGYRVTVADMLSGRAA